MKKDTKADLEKDNKTYLEANPRSQRANALEVLAKAKLQDAEKLQAGKKWTRVDNRTEALR